MFDFSSHFQDRRKIPIFSRGKLLVPRCKAISSSSLSIRGKTQALHFCKESEEIACIITRNVSFALSSLVSKVGTNWISRLIIDWLQTPCGKSRKHDKHNEHFQNRAKLYWTTITSCWDPVEMAWQCPCLWDVNAGHVPHVCSTHGSTNALQCGTSAAPGNTLQQSIHKICQFWNPHGFDFLISSASWFFPGKKPTCDGCPFHRTQRMDAPGLW